MIDSTVVREWVGWFVLVALGVWFLAVHMAIGYVEVVDNDNLYVGLVVTGVLAVGLVLADAWLSQQDLRPQGIFRIATWCLVTTLFTTVVGITLLLYEQTGLAVFSEYPMMLTNIGTTGAVVGVVAGEYDRRRVSAKSDLQTEKRRTRNLNERLTVLNRILRHDIRNDMNLIQGYAEMLEAGEIEPGDAAEGILQKSSEVIELSDRARQFERVLRSGESRTEVLDLAEFVPEHVEDVRERYVGVALSVSAPTAARVEASPFVRSAISNVIENAIEHNDKPTARVEVDLSVTDSRVVLSVSDDGPGIPPQELDIIERGVETPLDHSSGLGLWLIHWIVTESGGWVEHEPNEPTGTVVRLVFPRYHGE
jgi:signal transduction histidine kinase